MDSLSPEKRSENMRRIRHKNTKPEMIVRSLLHRCGYRFRLHRKDLPGKPDIVLAKYRTVVFVNGCFWHRHKNCRYAYNPKTNVEFWERKFKENVKRDQSNYAQLRQLGWQVLIIWECELKDIDALETRLKEALQI